jgi:glycerophosphoryl diester phosphodiesterase
VRTLPEQENRARGPLVRVSTAPLAVEGHRGARGLRPENTLAGFAHALALGVTTLELDLGMTRDGVVVVCHERRLRALECRDTGPVRPGDPAFPYVGRLVSELTLAQLRTIDAGTRRPADPAADRFVHTQVPVPGARIPTLAEVLALPARLGVGHVGFNLEVKVDPTRPHETAGPELLTRRVIHETRRAGVVHRARIQSFDWRVLRAARAALPRLRRAALAERATVYPGSPWTAGIAVPPEPFAGDGLARAVARDLGAQVLSPRATELTDGLLAAAHARGLAVIPWTVNEPAALARLVDRGVDGIITDYPDRLRTVLAARGMPLPPGLPARVRHAHPVARAA